MTAIVDYFGVTDMTSISKTLGLGGVSTLSVVNHWEREVVVRSRIHGRHRLVRLDPNFVIANELHDFRIALVQQSQKYLDLADVVRPRMQSILML